MKCNTTKNNSWQKSLIEVITDPKELLDLLELDETLLPAAKLAAKSFPLKVPRGLVARIKKGDINDPILRQILPLEAELDEFSDYLADPLQEADFNPLPGLLHKYHGRVLLTLTGVCGINCRYCFRRHFAYEENNPGNAGWLKTLDYIAQNPSISEVILSGGDPLIASDQTLKNITEKLAAIPHIKRLRIHSRLPIVLPERITPEFINAVTVNNLKTILVVHCNHAQEIHDEVRTAMSYMAKAGIILLNQAVLLKGVNDCLDTLVNLSEALLDAGILPYYLHVLDKVKGSAHFDLSRQVANELHWGMMQRLSGYLVPKLVCEQPGAAAKLPINSLEFCTE